VSWCPTIEISVFRGDATQNRRARRVLAAQPPGSAHGARVAVRHAMTNLKRTRARPLLLALASTATIAFGCGKDDAHPSGNLMASNTDLREQDQAIEIGDAGPSGNLMAAPDDMGNE
jgi:hypothetical protein